MLSHACDEAAHAWSKPLATAKISRRFRATLRTPLATHQAADRSIDSAVTVGQRRRQRGMRADPCRLLPLPLQMPAPAAAKLCAQKWHLRAQRRKAEAHAKATRPPLRPRRSRSCARLMVLVCWPAVVSAQVPLQHACASPLAPAWAVAGMPRHASAPVARHRDAFLARHNLRVKPDCSRIQSTRCHKIGPRFPGAPIWRAKH